MLISAGAFWTAYSSAHSFVLNFCSFRLYFSNYPQLKCLVIKTKIETKCYEGDYVQKSNQSKMSATADNCKTHT